MHRTPKFICSLAVLVMLSIPIAAQQAEEETPEGGVVDLPPEAREWTALVSVDGRLQELHYVEIDGDAVVGGDMIMGTHQELQASTAGALTHLLSAVDVAVLPAEQAQALTEAREALSRLLPNPDEFAPFAWGRSARNWPVRTIPYEIGPSVTDERLKQRIVQGVRLWNASAPVKLVAKAEAGADLLKKVHPIVFVDPGTRDRHHCASIVGYKERDKTHPIKVVPHYFKKARKKQGCSVGTIAHEIGHAVALHHEHQRTDREIYLDVVGSIDKTDPNYGEVPGEPYTTHDLCSIMHYGHWKDGQSWFSLTEQGEKVFRDCRAALSEHCRSKVDEVGQRCQLSASDVAGLEAMYKNIPER